MYNFNEKEVLLSFIYWLPADNNETYNANKYGLVHTLPDDIAHDHYVCSIKLLRTDDFHVLFLDLYSFTQVTSIAPKSELIVHDFTLPELPVRTMMDLLYSYPTIFCFVPLQASDPTTASIEYCCTTAGNHFQDIFQ